MKRLFVVLPLTVLLSGCPFKLIHKEDALNGINQIYQKLDEAKDAKCNEFGDKLDQVKGILELFAQSYLR